MKAFLKNGGRAKDPDPADEGPSAQQVAQVLQAMYRPAQSPATADEMVHPIDLIESVNQHINANTQVLHQAMKEAGFITTNIEGQLYWLVCYH